MFNSIEILRSNRETISREVGLKQREHAQQRPRQSVAKQRRSNKTEMGGRKGGSRKSSYRGVEGKGGGHLGDEKKRS